MGQVKYAKSMYEDTHLPFALGKKAWAWTRKIDIILTDIDYAI